MSQSSKSKTYTFVYSDKCNMCQAGPQDQAFVGRRLDQRQGLWPKRVPGIAGSVFSCRRCGLLYPNPMPIPASIGQHYDVNPEEYWPESYFENIPTAESYQVKTLRKLMGSSLEGKKVLDVGSGVGVWMIAFQRLGLDAYGIEPSKTFRDAAIARNGISPDKIQLSSLEDADFPDNTFAFINMSAVVEHLVDPAASIARAVKWLEPGGLLYVEVPSARFLQTRMVRWFYRLTGAGEYMINLSPMHKPYHLYEFGLKSFEAHGKLAGYSVRFHEFHPCAMGKPAFVKTFFENLMRRTDTGMQLSVWIERA